MKTVKFFLILILFFLFFITLLINNVKAQIFKNHNQNLVIALYDDISKQDYNTTSLHPNELIKHWHNTKNFRTQASLTTLIINMQNSFSETKLIWEKAINATVKHCVLEYKNDETNNKWMALNKLQIKDLKNGINLKINEIPNQPINYRLKIRNSFCNYSYTSTRVLNEDVKNTIVVYNNNLKNVLFLKEDEKILSIKSVVLFNSNGVLLNIINNFTKDTTIDLNNYEPGNYSLQIVENNGRTTYYQFIKV